VLSGQAGPLLDAAFSADGRFVATVGTAGTTRVWDWRRSQPLTQVTWHPDLIHSVEWSPDGRWILTGSEDWVAGIYPCESCAPLAQEIALAEQRVKTTVPPGDVDAIIKGNKPAAIAAG